MNVKVFELLIFPILRKYTMMYFMFWGGKGHNVWGLLPNTLEKRKSIYTHTYTMHMYTHMHTCIYTQMNICLQRLRENDKANGVELTTG